MTLDHYLISTGMSAADFGARCDPAISEASISRIRRHQQNITREIMQRIIAASGGRVTAEGLVQEAASNPRRPAQATAA